MAWESRIVGHGEAAPADLVGNPRNWRTHPKAQRDALAGVLDQVGWVQDVIVNRRTGYLVDGHARVAVAAQRGEASVPVVYVDLSEDEELLILATLDPLAAMAEADTDALADLLAAVTSEDAALTSMLAELAKAEGLDTTVDGLTDPDDVPDERETSVQRGEVYRLGAHRLMCGDSTDAGDVARLMGGAQADCVFTDPPYGVGYDGGAKKRDKLDGDHVGTTIYADALPNLRVAAADHAALYLWYADAHAAAAAAAAAAAGYDITAQIIWLKNNAQFVTSAHYKGKHEPCFYAHRRGKTARWVGPNNEVTVWEVNRAAKNDYHPTQKPVELCERALGNSTNAGDIVLDLFSGSGSTIIAAERQSRTCYAMEISEKYVQVCIDRWEAFTGLKAERV